MIKREDFIFTIGYQGTTAIVDGQAKKRHGKLTTQQLIEAGLFKVAFCSAVFTDDVQELQDVLYAYNRQSNSNYSGPEALKRLFGVFSVPENVDKIKVI